MLSRLLSRPVRLDLGASTLKFRSKRELELALGNRTTVSPLTIATLSGLTDEALVREAGIYRHLEQCIVKAVSQHQGVEELLVEIDLATITEENDWRSVIRGVRTLDPSANAYKRCALLKFMEYLTSRQELVNTIRGNRQHQMVDAGKSEPGAIAENHARQTLVFDLPELLAAGSQEDGELDDEFNRVPKGESIEIEFDRHQSLNLLMARYRFTMVSGEPYLLVDENGNDLKLRRGKNIVGRSAQCDVAIDSVFKAISRKHLIVEAYGTGIVKLTDISTLGTFVPRGYLDNRLH